jgi:hypothetical protein
LTDCEKKAKSYPNRRRIPHTSNCQHSQYLQGLQLEENTLLFRPVGENELRLIVDSGYRAFPLRLSGQPIFYPVLNEEYAAQIARDWNAKDSQSKAGYVTRFTIKTDYLSQFTVQKVGGSLHLEYWIPAEKLAEFNQNIVGLIEVISEFHGK